jgi:hypothetical protein
MLATYLDELLCYCATVLLCYCATVLLCYCATVLLCYCATVLLCYCATVLLSQYVDNFPLVVYLLQALNNVAARSRLALSDKALRVFQRLHLSTAQSLDIPVALALPLSLKILENMSEGGLGVQRMGFEVGELISTSVGPETGPQSRNQKNRQHMSNRKGLSGLDSSDLVIEKMQRVWVTSSTRECTQRTEVKHRTHDLVSRGVEVST